MTHVLLVVHLILCLGLIILVLIQRSEGGALSGLGGGGGGSGLMTGRSAANLLTRATALLAGGFMLTSLVLSLIANAERNSGSILDSDKLAPIVQEEPAAPKSEEPGAPLAK